MRQSDRVALAPLSVGPHHAERPRAGALMVAEDVTLAERKIGDHTFTFALLNEQEIDLDPTFLIFRDDEEVAIVTAHLNPDAPCTDRDHVVVSKEPL